MKTSLKLLLTLPALGLAAALPSANAQLALSGSAYGTFLDPGVAHTTVTNGSDFSSFASGVAYRPSAPYNDTQTSLSFDGNSFSGLGNGDRIDLGLLNITNGRTLVGTTAHDASMDIFLNLDGQASPFKLGTLLFTIDSTVNQGGLIPDQFLVDATTANSLNFGGRNVTFDVGFTNPAFGTGISIGEGTGAETGLFATIHFTPVPEASTYALWGAALLLGVVAVRRFRRPAVAA